MVKNSIAWSLWGVPVAALRIPNAISSNMVLQREPLTPRLWGFGDPAEQITVALDDWTGSVTADASGNWVIDLEKQQASVDKTITVSSSSGEAVTLTNIAFGDVYLCSGQSNMEFSTNGVFDAAAEIADSINYPDLRFYTIADTAADSPALDGISKANYQWGVSSPDAFVQPGGGVFSYFSATCYFFGRDLYKALDGKVPIGLVASDWGGQRVECFSSADALADNTCGGTVSANGADYSAPLEPRPWSPIEEASLKGFGDGPVPNPANSQLWYGQIYPFLNMRMTGATWYQGEANAGDPDGYACRFPAMIADWRLKFDLPNLSFFFVQLAAYEDNYAEIRNAQMAALKLPLTGYAVAIDIGDPNSPAGSIHPRRKQEVGRRLALSCQKVQYGMDVVSAGPTFDSYKATDMSLSVVYTDETVVGMHFAGTADCVACCAESPFQVQVFPSGQWLSTGVPQVANANEVTAPLTLPDGQTVMGVRFAWEGYPQCALYNGVGGPDDHTGIASAPFRLQTPLPVKSWMPVFRQTYPTLWKPGVLSLNPNDPDADNYAVLDTLEDLRSTDGSLEFKIRWADPLNTEANRWKQSSNPYTNAINKVEGVEGYEAIDVKHTENNWGGLQYNPYGQSLLDGTVGSASWFYAIGYAGANWGQNLAIPSFGRAASAVELFAMDPKTSKFTLVFRQTLPHLWDFHNSPWRVNADDVNAEMYSILDDLQRFRGADGKFEFKMMWPDAWNIWKQTSNPAVAGSVAGYVPVDVKYSDCYWGGLEYLDRDGKTLIDGSSGTGDGAWYYSVGYEGFNWGTEAIPAWCNAGAYQVELFVNVADKVEPKVFQV